MFRLTQYMEQLITPTPVRNRAKPGRMVRPVLRRVRKLSLAMTIMSVHQCLVSFRRLQCRPAKK